MKNVLITGASGGIGRAIALKFYEEGYRVFAGYFKNEPDFGDKRITKLFIDVTDEESVKLAVEKTGGVDILVNNSGISEQKLFTDISLSDFKRMFSVNTEGVFITSKAVLPYMINKKSGSIINISSIWGEIGASCEVHYSASKAAVIGLTKALAKELSLSGIRVNCVSPGMIETPMNNHLLPRDILEIQSEIPLGRQGEPKEVADAVFFLGSDMSEYITGQVISVSGGWNIC